MAQERITKRQSQKTTPAPPIGPTSRNEDLPHGLGVPPLMTGPVDGIGRHRPQSIQAKLGEAITELQAEYRGPYLNTSRQIGKSRDPEFRRVMVLLRKDTEKFAGRKWEDAEPDKDFSDLVELLLSEYVAGRVNI